MQDVIETDALFTADIISQQSMQLNYPVTADNASLLSNVPGVSINQACVSSVSLGGDSIGDSIVIGSVEPDFSSSFNVETSGWFGTCYSSNNNATGFNMTAEVASSEATITYVVGGQKEKLFYL